MTDINLLKKTSGELFYVPIADYVAKKSQLPAYTSTGQVAWRNAFDSLFNLQSAGVLMGFSYSFGGDNPETIYSMGCANTVAFDTIDRITNVKATIASFNHYEFISSMLNADLLNVASSPINVTNEAKGTGWSVGVPIKLKNKNHNNTMVSNVVVRAGSTELTLNVDYRLFLNNDGFTYIFPLTPQTAAITADYTYTVADATYMSLENKTIDVPRTAYKFVSCKYKNPADTVRPWRRDVIYFTECKLDGDITQKYYVQGESFEGSEVTFKADTGVALVVTLKGATEADVNV